MKNPFEGKEIWFLTGSQFLYGPETLDQVAEQSQTIANAIDEARKFPSRSCGSPFLPRQTISFAPSSTLVPTITLLV